MELTTLPAADSLRIDVRAPGWNDVVAEILASCRRRATPGALWQGAGALVLTRGAGPIGWVYGEPDPAVLLDVLASATAVNDVYVEADLLRVTQELAASGWSPKESCDHLVFEGRPASTTDHRIETLSNSDLPELRELLRLNGAPETLLASHYPDDFFEVCAPVTVLGVRVAGRLVGSVAVRQQQRSAFGFALNVAPGARGQGLGRALVAAAAEHAAHVGAAFIHAQCAGRNADLLRSCGWTTVGSWVLMRRD